MRKFTDAFRGIGIILSMLIEFTIKMFDPDLYEKLKRRKHERRSRKGGD